jgi:hypothetical protein
MFRENKRSRVAVRQSSADQAGDGGEWRPLAGCIPLLLDPVLVLPDTARRLSAEDIAEYRGVYQTDSHRLILQLALIWLSNFIRSLTWMVSSERTASLISRPRPSSRRPDTSLSNFLIDSSHVNG